MESRIKTLREKRGIIQEILAAEFIEAYRNKIEDIIRWNWYRKKYGRE